MKKNSAILAESMSEARHVPRSKCIMMPPPKRNSSAARLPFSASVPSPYSSSSSSSSFVPPHSFGRPSLYRSPTTPYYMPDPLHGPSHDSPRTSPRMSPRISFSNLSDAVLELSLGSSMRSGPTTPSLSPFSIGSGLEEAEFGLGPSSMPKPEHEVMGNVEEGVGGTYLVRSLHATDATAPELKVFKPTREEGFDKDKSTFGSKVALKRGVVYGETTLKEVAAYALDHQQWAGVPYTQLNSVTMPDGTVSRGSLQHFQSHVCSCEDMGTARFSVAAVHRIGLLDVRLLNLDRHLGNILVTSDNTLVPIDHGYVLPSYEDMGDVTFEWLYWHQCKVPFEADTLAYVEALDPYGDCYLLRSMGLREESIIAQFCATVFLKRAVRHGMNLFDIASMVQRDDCAADGEEDRSALEQLLRDLLKDVPLAGLRSSFDQSKEFFSALCCHVDALLPATEVSA